MEKINSETLNAQDNSAKSIIEEIIPKTSKKEIDVIQKEENPITENTVLETTSTYESEKISEKSPQNLSSEIKPQIVNPITTPVFDTTSKATFNIKASESSFPDDSSKLEPNILNIEPAKNEEPKKESMNDSTSKDCVQELPKKEEIADQTKSQITDQVELRITDDEKKESIEDKSVKTKDQEITQKSQKNKKELKEAISAIKNKRCIHCNKKLPKNYFAFSFCSAHI